MTQPIPTKIDPKLMDVACDELASKIEDNLSWIDNSFGKIETFIEGKGNTRVQKFPAIYTGSKKDLGYIKLLPDSKLGNFSYIEISSSHNLDDYAGSVGHSYDFSIIFWFDFRKVYTNEAKVRTVENVKHDVLNALKSISSSTFSVRYDSFVEGADNIYKGFNHNEIEHQFLMRPYGGFRINGRMKFNPSKCNFGI